MTYYLTIFLEWFILYKNEIVIAYLLCGLSMNIPMKKIKIMSNFVHSVYIFIILLYNFF